VSHAGGDRAPLPSYGSDEDLPKVRDHGDRVSGLQLLGAFSAAYGFLALCGSIASFTHAAFGPILLGTGGVRPPEPPLELRWYLTLISIFAFALAVMLMIGGFGTVRRMRRGALLLGLWSVCAIFVHAVFLAWEITLWDEMKEYGLRLVEAQRHALDSGGLTPRPLGDLEFAFVMSERISQLLRSLPFVYPVILGLLLLLPPSRRRIASWK